MNNFDSIVFECLARRRLTPGKDAAAIVAEVLADVAEFRAALSARPEFKLPGEAEFITAKAAAAAK